MMWSGGSDNTGSLEPVRSTGLLANGRLSPGRSDDPFFHSLAFHDQGDGGENSAEQNRRHADQKRDGSANRNAKNP